MISLAFEPMCAQKTLWLRSIVLAKSAQEQDDDDDDEDDDDDDDTAARAAGERGACEEHLLQSRGLVLR